MSPYIIIATIAAYLALLFAVAWVSSRGSDNEGFFVGNRRSPWFVVALGMIAAPMSGVTFVSVPGMVAGDGWAYLQMAMGFVCGYLVIAFVLVPMLYRRRVVSVYEYLEGRFGGTSYRTGAWFFFTSKILGAAVRVYVVCLVTQQLVFEALGVPFAVNAAVTMLLVWLYTFRGGVRALVWTDLLRVVILVGSVVVSIWAIARALGFDLGETVEAIRGNELSRVFFFDDARDPRYFFKQFFSGLFIVVAMTGLDQDMMQLPLSCPSPRDSQKNFALSGVMQFIVIGGFLCLGVMLNLYVSASGFAGASAAGAGAGAVGGSAGVGAGVVVPASASGDGLFGFVATGAGLPAVVGIVFALGLVASTYSAAGSALTALTTSFTVDILGGTKRFGEKRLGRVRRLVHASIAAGMVGIIIAFRALSSSSVIDAVYTLASYTYGPILGMFAFGLLVRRKVRDGWVPVVALAAPVLCLVLDVNSEAWMGGYRFGYEILIMNALLTMAGMAMSMKKKDRTASEATVRDNGNI